MKAALQEISTTGNQVTVSFKPVDEVELEDVGDGHLTACVLHTSQRARL
jgi:hypothetical protein